MFDGDIRKARWKSLCRIDGLERIERICTKRFLMQAVRQSVFRVGGDH